MEAINQLIPVAVQAQILQISILAGLAVPFLEQLVGMTANKVDDGLLGKFKAFLNVVGTILPGPGGLKK